MADCRDLTTLDAVKAQLYAGQASSSVPATDDAKIAAYITGISLEIARRCGRIKQSNDLFVAQTWSEIRTGNGSNMMRLRAWPIVSVTSVTIRGGGVAAFTQAAPLTSGGFGHDEKFVMLRSGYSGLGGWSNFPSFSPLNCQFVYVGGYNTPGMSAVAALADWAATTFYPQNSQLSRAGIVYTATIGGTSGSLAPTFPTTLGAIVTDGSLPQATIATAAELGTVATITTAAPHGFTPGQTVTIAGVSLAGYNGTYLIQSTPTTTTFTYTAVAGLGAGSGGTATGQKLTWRAESTAFPLVAGAQLLPPDLELTAREQAALVYKNAPRTGDQGQVIGGENINYLMRDMHPASKARMQAYIDWAGSLEGGEIAAAA